MPKDDLLFAPSVDVRIKIRKPFLVHLASEGGGVSARVEEINEFGYGSNRGEALDDLGKTISELYFSLSTERDRLSDDLAGTLRILEEHVVRVR